MPAALSIFVVVLAASAAPIVIVFRPTQQDRAIKKRISHLLDEGASSNPVPSTTVGFLRVESTGRMAAIENAFRHFRWFRNLELLIEQADRKVSAVTVIASCFGTLLLGIGIGDLVLRFIAIALLVGAFCSFIPVGVLLFLRSRRLKAFDRNLGDAISILSRALQAGHSVASAIEVVGEQARQPVAPEFRSVQQQQTLGLPYRDALMRMAARIPSRDLGYVVTALLVQKDTGGNLTEILNRTEHLIRQRLRLEGEMRVRTAQGRLTGGILIVLPILMGILLSIVSPGYLNPLLHDPFGQKLVMGALGLICIGGLVIFRITRVVI